jgi:hypothetical protein
MSSARKDARWLLAQQMVEKAGVEWEALDYPTHAALLGEAANVLAHASEETIERLAAEWNTHEEPDVGDGTAPPEENFWDDRTTPLAYSEQDSERDLAKRREFAAFVLEQEAARLDRMREPQQALYLRIRAKEVRENVPDWTLEIPRP